MSAYEHWVLDVAAGFAARHVRAAGPERHRVGDPHAQDAHLLAGEMLAGLQASELAQMSLSGLSALAALAGEDCAHLVAETEWGARVRELAEAADVRLTPWHAANDAGPASNLLNYAAQLFSNPSGTLLGFLYWAQQVGRTAPWGAWAAPQWQALRRQFLDRPEQLKAAELHFKAMNLSQGVFETRLAHHEALDTLVAELMGKRLSDWSKLSLLWLSRLHAWPLLVLRSDESDSFVGCSLPFGVDVVERLRPRQNRSAVLTLGERTYGVRSGVRNIVQPFSGVPLHFDADWLLGLKTAMDAARWLWVRQNSRLSVCMAKQAAYLRALRLDLTPAACVLRKVFGEHADAVMKRWPVQGRSAEAYLALVALGRMLPGSALPLGAASGRLEREHNDWGLGWVDGVDGKVEFALAAGFSRLVLPRAAGLAAGQGLGIELNPVDHLREAAAVMLPAHLWRSAFLRCLGVQEGMQTAVKALRTPGWTPAQRERFLQLHHLFIGERPDETQPVHVRRSDVSDADLGLWLAGLDNAICSPKQEAGPGELGELSVVVMRTQPEERPMRFWLALFELVGDRHTALERFQWLELEGAAAAIAALLLPGPEDAQIGRRPAPDLLVILDDGYRSKRDPERPFEDDFRGELADLFSPRPGRASPLQEALLAQGHRPRSPYLGHTRILLVERGPPVLAPAVELGATEDVEDVRALAVFRHGFSLAQAMAVRRERGACQGLGNQALRDDTNNLLWRLAHAGALLRAHARFQLSPSFRAALRDCPEVDPQADNIELHWAAACSFAPLLDGSTGAVALNRDDAHDAEADGEAAWHLHEIRRLKTLHRLPGRLGRLDALTAEFYLTRPFADWDTVLMIGKVNQSGAAFDLATDLLERERQAGREPHVSRIAAWIVRGGRAIQAQARASGQILAQLLQTYAELAGRSMPANQRHCLRSALAGALRLSARVATPPSLALLATLEAQLFEALAGPVHCLQLPAADYPLSEDWMRAVAAAASSPHEHRQLALEAACLLKGLYNTENWLKMLGMPEASPDRMQDLLLYWLGLIGFSESADGWRLFTQRLSTQLLRRLERPGGAHPVKQKLVQARDRLLQALGEPVRPIAPDVGLPMLLALDCALMGARRSNLSDLGARVGPGHFPHERLWSWFCWYAGWAGALIDRDGRLSDIGHIFFEACGQLDLSADWADIAAQPDFLNDEHWMARSLMLYLVDWQGWEADRKPYWAGVNIDKALGRQWLEPWACPGAQHALAVLGR